MRIRNLTRDSNIVVEGKIARNFIDRLVGLMGQSALDKGQGLLLDRCNSVHTFFMRFPLDLLFLDKHGTVIRTVYSIPPWRATRIVFGARATLELPAGVIRATGTQVGDRLQVSD